MEQKDIELFCKNRKVKYINHRDVGDGIVYINVEVERRTSEEEMQPYIDYEKMKDSMGESFLNDVIDWYNSNIKSEMLVVFQGASLEQKQQIIELYMIAQNLK